MKRLFLVLSILLALCLIIPLGYKVVNTGVITIAVLSAVCFVLYRFWDTIKTKKTLKTLIICVLAVGSSAVVALSALMIREAYFNAPPDEPPLNVIVLGAGVTKAGQPSLMLRRRLNAAARYMTANPESYAVVSGGQAKNRDVAEAAVMKNYLIERGIPADHIATEKKSYNTETNFSYSAPIFKAASNEPVIVVTDEFHQFRAGMYAKASGLDTYTISSMTPWGLLPAFWVREMIACAVAILKTSLG